MEGLRGQRHRPGTKRVYLAAWRNFNSFVIRLDETPPTWEERIALYVTYLVHEGYQSSTIKSYLSGIKAILADDNYEVKQQKMLLASLTQTCTLKNDTVRHRLPIQKGLLEMLLFEIKRKFSQQLYLKVMYQTVLLLAYYGLLRISEITGVHAIKAKDVHACSQKEKILLVLHSSKTHGKNKLPQQIQIQGDNKVGQKAEYFSPFALTRLYGSMRGNYNFDNDHFFVFRDGSPLKTSQVRGVLKTALKKLNLEPKLYGTHSLRIGRATDLLKFGVSVNRIKILGRWRSNAVFRYIRN